MLNSAIKRIKLKYKLLDFTKFLIEVDDFCSSMLPSLVSETNNSQLSKMLILKISNLLIAKYQFIHKHNNLLAYPFGLLVDPSNSCPLRCPGCLHGDCLKQQNLIDWPGGLLSSEKFELFINKFGPYALYMHFFNWGEPLLNRNTPHFINKAKQYGLDTVLSSNLNAKFNAEKLVLSGLDFLIMSIDGATTGTYQQYRRGGNLELVIENIKQLVAAKKKYNTNKPLLQWQFLTFKHNVHEINLARRMAKELGANSINFAKPYDVSWADPLIIMDDGHLGTENFEDNSVAQINKNKGDVKDTLVPKRIEDCYNSGWSGKISENYFEFSSPTKKSKSCQWLYKNMVMDANGRILPCCYAPEKENKYDYVFASISDTNIYNSSCYIKARKLEDNLPHKLNISGKDERKPPYCSICENSKVPNIDTRHIYKYFQKHNNSWSKRPLLSDESIEFLAEWNNESVCELSK